MWLEELAWLWLPIVGVVGLWLGRDYLAMKAELRKLVQRVDQLESRAKPRQSDKPRAA